ncbi:hypothetical protein [Lentzea pudingi]|nr:hypothetical protein [Lentzea pudingi]
MPDNQDTPAATPQTPPTSPIVMSTPIHDQIADHLGVRQKHRRPD